MRGSLKMEPAQRPASNIEGYAPLRVAGAKAAFQERIAAEDTGKKASFICQLFELDQPESGDCKSAKLHGKAAGVLHCPGCDESSKVAAIFPGKPGAGVIPLTRQIGEERTKPVRDKVPLLADLFRLGVPTRDACPLSQTQRGGRFGRNGHRAVAFVTGSS